MYLLVYFIVKQHMELEIISSLSHLNNLCLFIFAQKIVVFFNFYYARAKKKKLIQFFCCGYEVIKQ